MSTQTDSDLPQPVIRDAVAALHHNESRRILATLIRLLGDFDLAEDAMHTAFRLAIEQWPRDGIPASPRAWLVSTARFKAIDMLRRQSKHEAPLDDADAERLLTSEPIHDDEPNTIDDDRLRLIFICCHPALPADARVALTLREVCGLSTGAIASAFLSAPSTVAQRLVRAKAKIKSECIPYRIPPREELPERLQAVLLVIYLVYNEGYSASSGDTLTRPVLSAEAMRLGRLCDHSCQIVGRGGRMDQALSRGHRRRRIGARAGFWPGGFWAMTQPQNLSRGAQIGSWLMWLVAIPFLIFDGAIKVIQESHAVEATVGLGFGASALPTIGVTELLCLAPYLIPRTAVPGAVLITDYLGGAMSIQLRAGAPLFSLVFPIIIGVLLWGALFIREPRLRTLLPWRR